MPELSPELVLAALAEVGPAFLVALGVLAVVWLRGGEGAAPATASRGARVLPVALGLGYAASHLRILGLASLANPVSLNQKLLLVAAAAALVGAWEGAGRPWTSARAIGRLVLAFAALGYLLAFKRRHDWGAGETALRIGALSLWVLLLGVALDPLARRRPGASLPLCFLALLAASAGALLLGASASLAQFAGALAAAMGAVWLVALRRPELSLAGGGLGLLLLLQTAFLLGGVYTAELPASSAVLLAAAPALAWAGEWGPLRRLPPFAGALVRAGLVLLPCATAMALAFFQATDDPYAGF